MVRRYKCALNLVSYVVCLQGVGFFPMMAPNESSLENILENAAGHKLSR
jgi:hypothetical protein